MIQTSPANSSRGLNGIIRSLLLPLQNPCRLAASSLVTGLDALCDIHVGISLAAIAGAATRAEDVKDGHGGGAREEEPTNVLAC